MSLLYETYATHSFAPVKDTEKTLVIIAAYPSSSIRVLDAVTKKPLQNIKVIINTTQKLTDSSGIAVLDLPKGTYTVKIGNSAYLSKTLQLTLPLAEPLTVELWPLWTIGLGIVASAMVVTAVVAKAVWK